MKEMHLYAQNDLPNRSGNPIIILSAAVGPIAFFLGYSYDKQEKVLEQLLKELEKSERPPSDDSL